MSSSVGVLAAVYEKIPSNAVTRCNAKSGNLFSFHNDVAEFVATLGVSPETITYLSGIRPGSATGLGRSMPGPTCDWPVSHSPPFAMF